ncbi:MAG: hypothetical protein IKZ53_03920 [Selenomonadaceae bacterium]|nr:hypothetical protein [Selenomonadaceae bacterium]
MNLMTLIKYVGGSIIEMPLQIVDRQLEFYQQRKNAEHAQQLRMEEASFMQQLDMERQKFSAELNEMIANNEIERSGKVVEIFMEYQKTMAKCTTSIQESLGKMTIELRRQAHDLMEEKKRLYYQMQKDATNSAMEQLKTIRREFPEGSMEYQIMGDAVRAQIIGIVENSNRFMKVIDEDFARMVSNLDTISRNAEANANQYLSMAFGNLLQSKFRGDTKLLRD